MFFSFIQFKSLDPTIQIVCMRLSIIIKVKRNSLHTERKPWNNVKGKCNFSRLFIFLCGFYFILFRWVKYKITITYWSEILRQVSRNPEKLEFKILQSIAHSRVADECPKAWNCQSYSINFYIFELVSFLD